MIVDGLNYRLTKHGRQRFIKRVGLMSDADILRTVGSGELVELIQTKDSFIMRRTGKALGFIDTGFLFIFRPDWKGRQTLRLVTVYWAGGVECLAAHMDTMDRVSEHTFQYSDFMRRLHNE